MRPFGDVKHKSLRFYDLQKKDSGGKLTTYFAQWVLCNVSHVTSHSDW